MSGFHPYFDDRPQPQEGTGTEYAIHAEFRNCLDVEVAETGSDALRQWVERFGLFGYDFVCARQRTDPYQHFEVQVSSGEIEYLIHVVPTEALEGRRDA